MLKGETKSGFIFEISDSALNNFELVEALAEVDENPLLLPKVVRLLLGDEQKKKLFDHVRVEDGTVPTNILSAEVMEILQSGKTPAGETKNS